MSKKWISFGLVVALVLIFDQLTKWIALQYFVPPIDVLPIFNLVLVYNEGVSFGMFSGKSPQILIGISLVIIAVLLSWIYKEEHRGTILALSFVIAGAIGNVIDRAIHGAVVDFLDFHLGDWHYPAFNIADSCIVLGVIYLIIYSLFFDQNSEKENENKGHEKQ